MLRPAGVAMVSKPERFGFERHWRNAAVATKTLRLSHSYFPAGASKSGVARK